MSDPTGPSQESLEHARKIVGDILSGVPEKPHSDYWCKERKYTCLSCSIELVAEALDTLRRERDGYKRALERYEEKYGKLPE